MWILLVGTIFGVLAMPAGAWATAGAERGEIIVYVGLTDGIWQVRSCAPGGGDDRVLTDDPVDKTRLSHAQGRPADVFVVTQDGHSFFLNIATGRREPVGLGIEGASDAVVSPDGLRVACSLATLSAIDNNDIFVIDLKTGERRLVVSRPGVQNVPAWSADGGGLYFSSGTGNDFDDIHHVNLSEPTADPVPITQGCLYNFDVAVSGTGKLAFSSNRSGDYEIFTAGPNGESPRRITFRRGFDGSPCFSPDGRSLAWLESDASGQRIVGRRVDTWVDRIPRRLTPEGVDARSPLWLERPTGDTAPKAGLTITHVSADRMFFDPKRGETARVSAVLSAPAHSRLEIRTLDGTVIRTIEGPDPWPDGTIRFDWGGRDDRSQPVEPDVYLYRIAAWGKGAGGADEVVYDLSAAAPKLNYTPEDVELDKEAGAIRYVLPGPSCVRLHLGLRSQVLLLRTLIDFEPRPAGLNSEPWDGFDQSHLLRFDDNPDFHVFARAFRLPANSLVVKGRRRRPPAPDWSGVTVADVPVGKRMYQQGQQKRLEAFDPPAIVRYLAPEREGEQAALIIDTEPAYRSFFLAERLEVCIWLDGKMFFEDEAGYLPYTYRFNPAGMPGESHIFSVNIIGYDGHFGIASIRVPGLAAARDGSGGSGSQSVNGNDS